MLIEESSCYLLEYMIFFCFRLVLGKGYSLDIIRLGFLDK